jgi:mRNA interferase MazF
VKSGWFPRRGDLVWLDFHPQSGREQSGRRPALILSADDYNKKVGLALCVPVTSKKKGYPFEVELPSDCRVSGVVLADQLRSLDWRLRNAEFLGRLDEDTMREILARFLPLITSS